MAWFGLTCITIPSSPTEPHISVSIAGYVPMDHNTYLAAYLVAIYLSIHIQARLGKVQLACLCSFISNTCLPEQLFTFQVSRIGLACFVPSLEASMHEQTYVQQSGKSISMYSFWLADPFWLGIVRHDQMCTKQVYFRLSAMLIV